MILVQVVLTLFHVHLLMTMAHKDHITLIGIALPLDHPIDITGVIHVDMMVMMPETITIGLVVTIGIIITETIALDIIVLGMIDWITILLSVIADTIIAMITIKHLADNGKVKVAIGADTRVTIVPVVMLRIHIVKMVIKVRIEVIVSMTTTSIFM